MLFLIIVSGLILEKCMLKKKTAKGHFPPTRLRRLRGHANIRSLVQETYLHPNKLVLPLFIKHGSGIKNPIVSMPGHFQLSVDQLEEEIQIIWALGIKSIILFGIPEHKDALGADSYSDHGIIQTAIPMIKNAAPDMLIMSDICLCEYTDHGHCGVVIQHENSHDFCVDNDKTLALLASQAVSHAKAGTDIIAPSANMDGMVQEIRTALDDAGYQHIPILSYSVKYASSMYGPFRAAAEGAPKFGDRRTYQMDFTNANEALRECTLDIEEGADMLMVKPAHTYLDIIRRVKEAFPHIPLGAYHTSGEFAMIKAAAEKGWIDEQKGALEVLTAIHRAGADFIITYYAKEVATWLNVE
jgi:porphobilinogen synthase